MTKSYQRSSLFTNAFTSDQGSYAKNLYLELLHSGHSEKEFFQNLEMQESTQTGQSNFFKKNIKLEQTVD